MSGRAHLQYDMHYHGTYAMAAAAGIPKDGAEVIANAAQFVDDENFERWVIAKSGEGIFGNATAHLAHRAKLLDGRIDTNPARSPDSEPISE